MRRVRELLAPGGLVLTETHPDPLADERLTVQFAHTGAPIGIPFPCAFVGRTVLRGLAEEVGFVAEHGWSTNERSFTVLRRHR